MKPVNIGLTVILWLLVIFMGYKLYDIINKPVTFAKNLEVRGDATKDRLQDIKVAQEYYKQLNGTYASDFDDLIGTIKSEELQIIKVNGDPDDSTSVVTYDTIMKPILEEIVEEKRFKGTEDVNQLRYVPMTENLEFSLATDTIKVQRVTLSVFEAKATKEKYLSGLEKARIANPVIEHLSIGSLESASGRGSWE